MGEEAEVLPEVTEQPGLDIKEPVKESVYSENTGITEEATEVVKEEQPAKVVFDEAQQKIIDDVAAKGSQKFKDQERISQGLQAQLDEAKAKIPKSLRPAIPDLPEQFDDKYAEKMAARDKAITDSVNFDAKEKAESDRALQDQQTQQVQELQDIKTIAENYFSTAGKLNIDQEELKQAGAILVNAGVPTENIKRLMLQPNGSQITMFLAKNPQEVNSFAAMGLADASVALAIGLTQKASEMFKPTDFPPDPTETLKGGGAQEGDPYAIKGVKVHFG